MIKIKCYHTQKRKEKDKVLYAPMPGEGQDQWLGDGFYFWQDYEFAAWWGRSKKCYKDNFTRIYDIYDATLIIDDDAFIDTVFNEKDYRKFVEKIEYFAEKYFKKYRIRPLLEEFNDFIADHNLWEDIEAIRFQDVPENNELVKVTGYYYKKRIQIRVNNPELIYEFKHQAKFLCP